MKSIETILDKLFRETQKELFEFIHENYGENDPDLSVEKLNKRFTTNEIQITNDKFTESKGRGRPRKDSSQR
jgi:hypothetical protein